MLHFLSNAAGLRWRTQGEQHHLRGGLVAPRDPEQQFGQLAGQALAGDVLENSTKLLIVDDLEVAAQVLVHEFIEVLPKAGMGCEDRLHLDLVRVGRHA